MEFIQHHLKDIPKILLLTYRKTFFTLKFFLKLISFLFLHFFSIPILNNSNQEELERVKKDIEEEKTRRQSLDVEAERTMIVLQSIKEALVEMLLKLQELDEMTADIQTRRKLAKPLGFPLPDLVTGNITTEQIVKILEEKVKVGMIASGQLTDGVDTTLSEEEEIEEPKPAIMDRLMGFKEDEDGEEVKIIPKSPSVLSFGIDEKPAAYPQVYSSLIAGRSTGLVSSASPGAGVGGASEEEADVPSRSFLKRQANLILDAKSRRKFRQQQPGRRK